MNIPNIIPPDLSGCISITKGNKIIFEDAFGYSDMPNKIPNTLSTRFATASAGKVFVAVGILKLIEEGKLSLESSIGKLLTFDLKKIDPDITVEQLLTHTSGIPDYFDESVMNDYEELWRDFPNYKIRSSSDLIPLFINKPMMYPKGERFLYNNTGFVVLGLIIEAVTGLHFDEYLNKHVFLPCGMEDTGYYELDRLPARCANSYIFDKTRGGWYTNIYSVDVKGTGAGGAFTTVSDVKKFWDGLSTGKLISESILKEMLSPHSCSEDEYYGYGIWLSKQPDGSFTPYFEGCDPGVSFFTSRYNERTIITIVSNTGFNVWKLKQEIAHEIEGQPC
jgi:CubicO group peptidase (beta-lactamase class C family)